MNCQERITAVRFRELLMAGRLQWEQALEQIPLERWDDLVVPGHGSIKDLIAHIAWYEAEMVSLLLTRDFTSGSGFWFLHPDERNAAIHAERTGWTRDRTEKEERELFAALLALVADLDEVDLNEAEEFHGMPEDATPWELIAGNTVGHYEEHLPDLLFWLER